MTVKQIYTLVNAALGEVTGATDLVQEDLTGLVDAGDGLSTADVDNFVKQLVDRIGKTVFLERAYEGFAAKLYKDAWEFGSVLQAIQFNLVDAEEDPSWNLQDGQSVDQYIFHKPTIEVKYLNQKAAFELPLTICEKQVREAFTSGSKMNSFISGLELAIRNSLTIAIDDQARWAVNNMIGLTLLDEHSTGVFTTSGIKHVNLLAEYNAAYSTTLTADEAMLDKEFIRYACYRIGQISDRIKAMSTLYNIAGSQVFTPAANQNLMLLSDFKRAADVYLQSETFHDEFTALPAAQSIPFWQGSGDDFSTEKCSTINIKTSEGDAVEKSYIIGVLCDEWAVSLCNEDRHITSAYNARGEYTNYFYKDAIHMMCNPSQNFVVFTL